MEQQDCKNRLIAAATPLFATKGIAGVSVREIARAARVTHSLVPYYFDSKEGLYAAVLREQFAGLAKIAALVGTAVAPAEKFTAYLYECGICFHRGPAEGFAPLTASADLDAPECPCCLNNDAACFAQIPEKPDQTVPTADDCHTDEGSMAEAING